MYKFNPGIRKVIPNVDLLVEAMDGFHLRQSNVKALVGITFHLRLPDRHHMRQLLAEYRQQEDILRRLSLPTAIGTAVDDMCETIFNMMFQFHRVTMELRPTTWVHSPLLFEQLDPFSSLPSS